MKNKKADRLLIKGSDGMGKIKKVGLLTLIMILLISSTIAIGYADVYSMRASAGGGLSGKVGTNTGGTWNDNMQGYRISVLDFDGNPAFKYYGKDHVDLVFSYPPDGSYGMNGKFEDYDKKTIRTTLEEARGNTPNTQDLGGNVIVTFGDRGGFIDKFTGAGDGAVKFNIAAVKVGKTVPDTTAVINNLKNFTKWMTASGNNFYTHGDEVRTQFYCYDVKATAPSANAAIFAILNCWKINDAGNLSFLWRPVKEANLGDNPFTSSDFINIQDGNISPMQLMAQKGCIVSVEPIIANYLHISGTQGTSYYVYGTQTDVAGICNHLIENGSDFGKSSLAKYGGWDTVLFGKVGRKAMITTSVVTTPNGGLNVEVPPSDKATSRKEDTAYYVTNDEALDPHVGWGVHLYGFEYKDDSTHTWDNHNYPGKPDKYEEHKAPDPKEDPETKGSVVDSSLHYRIVKVYEEEEFGEDGVSKVVNHVKTLTRAPTVQKIKIQDEKKPGGYKLIEWKYAKEYYGGAGGTDNGQDIKAPPLPEGTPWDTTVKCDNPTDLIAKVPQLDKQHGTEEKLVDIGNKEDKNQVVTLYVRLRKEVQIPETSTWDEDNHPPKGGDQPYVDPHPSDDPKDPPVTDPQTTPVDDSNKRFCHYRIVKVYETEHLDLDESDPDYYTTDAIGVTYETNPIVYIEDEGQKPKGNKPDKSWHLIQWLYSDDYHGNGDDWESVVAGVNPKGSGTTEAKVDLMDKSDVDKVVTLYVRLIRKEGAPLRGKLNIEQSQISKTIHTNDTNIGSYFGNYRFAMTVGSFQTGHTTYFGHCCVGGDCRYHSCACLGHWCSFGMPGSSGDNKVNFNFDLVSSQNVLEIPKGVHLKTDPKIYGKGGTSVNAISDGLNYPETVSTLSASGNKFYYSGNANDSKGVEYVAVLWRCSEGPYSGKHSEYNGQKIGLNDVPTLALYKKNDITTYYGAENYELPETILKSEGSSPDKKAHQTRATAAGIFPYEFTFGLHSRSDITATASCNNLGGDSCIATDTQDYYPIEGTAFTYDFETDVAIQFYAGTPHTLQAQPFGGKSDNPKLNIATKRHTLSNIIQGKQEIKYFPYIRMTYMVNSLKDAEREEKNTYEDGYKEDVRKDTYVLSVHESSVLPSDAVEVGWSHKNSDDNTISLISQQWSLHKKAMELDTGSPDGNKNKILPGGAIFQLTTTKENLARVNATTYQTVVDQKARSEYLSANLSGDEYTEDKVAKDHKDFINDLKETIDNLKIVQWVNKNPKAPAAWPADFDTSYKDGEGNPADGAVKLRGLGESLTELRTGAKNTANTDAKYYVRQQETLSNYQNANLSDWSQTISKAQGIEEKGYEGDLDIFNLKQTTTVFKLFTDTSGKVYLASLKKDYENAKLDNTAADIKEMISNLKDLNADTLILGRLNYGATIETLCDKKTPGNRINSILTEDAKDIDDHTSFITNFVSSLTRNRGTDTTAEWANGKTDGKWYNEAFDGVYLVRQSFSMDVGLQLGTVRVAALDPALCPPNKGQSDLFTSCFLSQFCLDSRSNATIASGKAPHYVGTFKDTDIVMADMESMFKSRKFWIPNGNVQDLN